MLVGRENWPRPEPAIPARQLDVQTSLCTLPSLTPHPHAATKLPLASNCSTRAWPLSATYTAPFDCSIATPAGAWNWPASEPPPPKLLIWLSNTARAVAAPNGTVKARTAHAPLATRAAPPRPRPQRSPTILVRNLPATRCETRDGLIDILFLLRGRSVATAQDCASAAHQGERTGPSSARNACASFAPCRQSERGVGVLHGCAFRATPQRASRDRPAPAAHRTIGTRSST